MSELSKMTVEQLDKIHGNAWANSNMRSGCDAFDELARRLEQRDSDYESAVIECDELLSERDELARRLREAEKELRRLDSWEGLMERFSETYPSDIFDGSSGDVGARLIVAIRELDNWKRRAEAAEAVVGKFMTKDDVPVSGLSELYFAHPEVDQVMVCKAFAVDLFNQKAFVHFQGAEYRTDLFCYSTPEAAEAAKSGGDA